MTSAPAPTPAAARDLLRHTVATLAYRAEKVLREMPDSVATSRIGDGTRTPAEILSHMADLMDWAVALTEGEYRWAPQPMTDWSTARERFFTGLADLDAALAEAPLDRYPPGIIFQGPIADALTHVGQLALLRGLGGSPIRPESYARAEIAIGRVGPNQSATRREFDGDASQRR
jgi:hypothetical protein